MKSLLFTLFMFVIPSYGQVCQSGGLYVTGTGCGCGSGCDLSPYGGPDCGGGTLGNCLAGYAYMSYRVFIPSGCTVEASAKMENKTGCSFSGADGGNIGCTAGDRLRVYSSSNSSKEFTCGSSNEDINDIEIVVGPDSLIIEGYANRSDEMIHYNIAYSAGTCLGCSALPIELESFRLSQKNNQAILQWSFGAIPHNSTIWVLKSSNAIDFQTVHEVLFDGSQEPVYTFTDPFDLTEPTYYRLAWKDEQGNSQFTGIQSLLPEFETLSIQRYFTSPNSFALLLNSQEPIHICLLDAMGGKVLEEENLYPIESNYYEIATSLAKGIYTLQLLSPQGSLSKRIAIL